MSPFPIGTFVETFLDQSKDDARRLIRHKMESMLDSLVESLFKQLKDKFVLYLEASSDFHQRPLLGHDGDGLMIRQTISNAQQNHCQSLVNAPSINANCQLNPTNHQPAVMSIKQEINDPSNVLFEPQHNQHSINSSSSTHESSQFPDSMIQLTGESLPNTEMQHQHQPLQLDHIKHNQFDEEECVDGGIEVNEEDGDESFQLIDQEEESSRPVKKPRMNSTQQNNAQTKVTRQSPRLDIEANNETQLIEDKRQDENCDRMGSEQSEAIDTRASIEHFDHGQHNSNESMVIQQEEMDANNAIEEDIATECTTNPIQSNLAQPNRHLQCSHCLKSFDRKFNLQRHLRMHTGERPFQCNQCDKLFKFKDNLTQHQLIHQNRKNFQCHQCEKQFNQKHTLDSHLRVHSGERPFECRHCEMSFNQLNVRNIHEQAIHLHVKPYRCKQCGHTATQRSDVIKHIRAVHFGLPESIKEQRALNIIDERDPRELVEKV